MDRFLFVFGILVFFFAFIFFVMSFFAEHDGVAMVISIFAMLNASIAIGVSEILARTKNLK
ncbi:hypothetical protein AWH56_018445 [Anaerobacillus isosaccharinicus]|uniref:Uncharacterized protein n=1 Tax=Anaerobacillus isosaccharinicus TaxID=1532552 RepID=A0A1S2MDS1_9BACI|nr:hypothetical protein [Anaerobacillus isosaccharinicus]MBA5587115.1 hypothetical protein [Anaerobacillus isosaccharinicus]QOY34689.1 hypothetical protein AWH56_018445 [Anaerobacillus isosaccharinicus]